MSGVASPPSDASVDRTSGASWHGSPTKTTRLLRTRGIHAAGSVACAASSRMTRSNAGSRWMFSAPAPTAVASTTDVPVKIFRSAFARTLFPDLASVRCSRLRFPSFVSMFLADMLSPRPFTLLDCSSCCLSHPCLLARSISFFRPRLASKNAPVSLSILASNELSSAADEILSGAPTRTKSMLAAPTPDSFAALSLANRSTRLSTAALEGAHARTLCPDATARRMISMTTPVFPVPGGPWIHTTGAVFVSAMRTASCCAGSKSTGIGPPPPSATGRVSSGGRSAADTALAALGEATSGASAKKPMTRSYPSKFDAPSSDPCEVSASEVSTSEVSFGHLCCAKRARTTSIAGGPVLLFGTFASFARAASCLS
mmetsp:Transcript_3618/g.16617  ORF Transcript_3618/g.16617 Transcript_3618/m.16617 type:complete len:372 (-) Transcript_3618:656-1771(-)